MRSLAVRFLAARMANIFAFTFALEGKAEIREATCFECCSLKINVGETVFTPSTQSDIRQVLYSFIFHEYVL